MESLFFKGVHTSATSLPTAAVGDLFLMGVDGTGALAQYKTGDLILYTGASTWVRINNQDTASLGASAITFASTAGLVATNVAAALDELQRNKMAYQGLVENYGPGQYRVVGSTAGSFWIADANATVEAGAGTLTVKKGDAVFFDGTSYSVIPFSQAFPANGATYTGPTTANAVAKFSTTSGNLVDSIISDNGTKVTIAGALKAGAAEITTLKVADTGKFTTTVDAATGSGAVALTLPARNGTIALTDDYQTAAQTPFDNTNTGILATDVQAAFVEMEKEKLSYAGTISSAAYPTTPIVGGLYLVTATVTIGTTNYKKGDWANYNGTAWTQIPAGYTTAADTDFNNSAVTRPSGVAVTAANVQEALSDLYAKKADLGADGKVLTSQLPSSVLGTLQYQSVFDAGAASALPTDTVVGHYYVVTNAPNSSPVVLGGLTLTTGDWIVRDASGWQVVEGGEAVDGITVGAATLAGNVSLAATGPLVVAAAGNAITFSVDNATKLAKGVVQVGDGIAVDSNGIVSVDTGAGVKIDSATKKVTLNLGSGVQIDVNGKLSALLNSDLQFNATTSAIEIAPTGVAAGQYTKVTVNAAGQVTSATNLVVADIPLTDNGSGTDVQVYNETTGVLAGLTSVTPGLLITKTGDQITFDGTQTNATALSSKFAVGTQTAFNWTARTTGTDAITSLIGAINANRDDLSQYVELLNTKGAAVGVAAGANLIGAKGIAGVTPTGKTAGADGTVQEVLEGLKDFVGTALADFNASGVIEASTTGNTGYVAVFTADDKIGKGNIQDTGTQVGINVKTVVQDRLTVVGTGELVLAAAASAYSTTVHATEAGNSLALALPSKTGVTAGTILADFSVIDGGDYDL
jgi:hypothetical protein